MIKLPLLQDTQFILWAIPVLGFILSIVFDWGYLNYFDIPFFYAEVNYYTAFSSILSITLICMGSFLALSIGYRLSHHRNILISFLFDPFILTFCFLIFTFSLASNDHFSRAYHAYIVFIIFKIIYAFALFYESGSFIKGIKQSSLLIAFGSSDTSEREREIAKNDNFSSVAGYIFVVLFIAMFMSIAGSLVAQTSSNWTLEGEENVIVIPRNNGIYLLKRFDQKTFVLDSSIKVISASVKEISLHPIKLDKKLITKFEYDKQQENEKRQTENQQLLSDLSRLFSNFLLTSNIADWI